MYFILFKEIKFKDQNNSYKKKNLRKLYNCHRNKYIMAISIDYKVRKIIKFWLNIINDGICGNKERVLWKWTDRNSIFV